MTTVCEMACQQNNIVYVVSFWSRRDGQSSRPLDVLIELKMDMRIDYQTGLTRALIGCHCDGKLESRAYVKVNVDGCEASVDEVIRMRIQCT